MSAKQKGDRQLTGSLGDITFKRTRSGKLIAHQKATSIAGKIATHAKFEMTRQNNTEFTRAGNAGKLIRDAIRSQKSFITDLDAIPRLLKLLLGITKLDPIENRGLRKPGNGPLQKLEGFEFNGASALKFILTPQFTSSIDRVAGTLKLDIGGFVPATKLKIPVGATHFQISSTALEIDFDAGTYVADTKVSALLPCDNDAVADISLTANVTPASTKPLIHLLSIKFSQQLLNGSLYPIIKADFNPLQIVAVDKE